MDCCKQGEACGRAVNNLSDWSLMSISFRHRGSRQAPWMTLGIISECLFFIVACLQTESCQAKAETEPVISTRRRSVIKEQSRFHFLFTKEVHLLPGENPAFSSCFLHRLPGRISVEEGTWQRAVFEQEICPVGTGRSSEVLQPKWCKRGDWWWSVVG